MSKLNDVDFISVIKAGPAANLATKFFYPYELLYTNDTNKLYVANSAGIPNLISGRRKLTADTTVYVGFFTGTLVGGSSYTTGTYLGVSLTGGSGSGATADIFVAGGAVIAVRITSKGTGYVIGNVLSANAASIGGTGSGFTFTILGIGNDAALDGTSQASPYLNPQIAYDEISEWDFAGFTVTLRIAAGVYTPIIVPSNGIIDIHKSWIGGGGLVIQGDSATFQGVLFNQSTFPTVNASVTIDVPLSGTLRINYICVYTRASYRGFDLINSGGINILLSNCGGGGAGAGPDELVASTIFAPALLLDNFTITTDLITVFQGGTLQALFLTVTALVPITSAAPLVANQFGGHVFMNGVTWVGSYSGFPFFVGEKDGTVPCSILDQTYGTGDAPIPGSVPGRVQTDGTYFRRDFSGSPLRWSKHGINSVVDNLYVRIIPINGFSYPMVDGTGHLLLKPAGVLASGTITMPPNPVDGEIIDVRTSNTITALTVAPSGGQSVLNPPTTLAAGKKFDAFYCLADTAWYITS